jgi:hypothetical protein
MNCAGAALDFAAICDRMKLNVTVTTEGQVALHAFLPATDSGMRQLLLDSAAFPELSSWGVAARLADQESSLFIDAMAESITQGARGALLMVLVLSASSSSHCHCHNVSCRLVLIRN